MAQFKIPLQGSQSPSFLVIESEDADSAQTAAEQTMSNTSIKLGEATEYSEDESESQPS